MSNQGSERTEVSNPKTTTPPNPFHADVMAKKGELPWGTGGPFANNPSFFGKNRSNAMNSHLRKK